MNESTGLYRRVGVDANGAGVVSHAGGVAVVDTILASGLDAGLRAALSPWRRPLAVHDPAKVLLDLAVSLALGGDCLADIAPVRAAPQVFGLVASDPTVSRTIDRLAADAGVGPDALDCRVAPECPPGPASASRRARSSSSARNTTSESRRLRQRIASSGVLPAASLRR